MAYQPPRSVQEARIIELFNDGDDPLLLESVRLTNEVDAAPLVLQEALIAPAGTTLKITNSPRSNSDWPRAAGYCLAPGSTAGPVLALRIALPDRDKSHGYAMARNNNVNVNYRTSDGRLHIAVFPVRFEYPTVPPA